jgi:hypothetical protein
MGAARGEMEAIGAKDFTLRRYDYCGEILIGGHPGTWREVHYRNVDSPRWMASLELGHGPHVQVDAFRIGLHQIVCFLRV